MKGRPGSAFNPGFVNPKPLKDTVRHGPKAGAGVCRTQKIPAFRSGVRFSEVLWRALGFQGARTVQVSTCALTSATGHERTDHCAKQHAFSVSEPPNRSHTGSGLRVRVFHNRSQLAGVSVVTSGFRLQHLLARSQRIPGTGTGTSTCHGEGSFTCLSPVLGSQG